MFMPRSKFEKLLLSKHPGRRAKAGAHIERNRVIASSIHRHRSEYDPVFG